MPKYRQATATQNSPVITMTSRILSVSLGVSCTPESRLLHQEQEVGIEKYSAHCLAYDLIVPVRGLLG